MNWRAVVHTLAHLVILLAFCMAAPLAVAFIHKSDNPRWQWEIASFLIPMALSLGAGLWMKRMAPTMTNIGRREGFAVVTFSWLIMTLVGMLPFIISGTTTSLSDAFFETMSGFTTTGATIFSKVEILPKGVQFWRCMTQWLGGMGVVVLSVAILKFLGVGGYRLLKAEAPGGIVFEREKPQIIETAKELWKLYLGISALQVVLLKVAGMTLYDAFCHTFTTMSTGGFSPHTESIAYFSSPWIQWIIIVFMFIAGANFSLYSQVIRLKPGALFKNPEFRLYSAILLVAVVIGLFSVPYSQDAEQHLRDTAFQVVSIATTTGYATVDFDMWPEVMRLVLLLLMFTGGCMGSTGGGIKSARILIYSKALLREMHRLIYPHSVRPLRVGQKVIDRKIVTNIMAFGWAYLGLFIIGCMTVSASGYDLVTSASASAAALGNIGPGLAKVGPTCNWGHLPDATKWVMSILMLLGRLEIFSVIILFTPWAWKR